MLRPIFTALLAAALPAAAAAQDYRPAFDPGTLKGPRTGTPNAVLVLGSPHLSALPEAFDPARLDGLIGRLEAWRPEAIAIEAVSGPQCDFMRRHPARYRETIESYCWDPAPAQAATGLDVPAAAAEAERLLADWPDAPTPGQRRRLAALFLAAGEPPSALVQWLRLDPAERRAGDGLDATLAARLETLRTRRNENYLIAAPLAARLGLERVHAIDDHSADRAIAATDEEAYAAAIRGAWDNPASARRRAASEARESRLGTDADVIAMYRAYNSPEEARLAFESDFGAALEEGSPQGFGRRYVGWWETRNLRMAANVREMLAERPGTRALVIVGASHKGYVEAYLAPMHDVRLVDAQAVLR